MRQELFGAEGTDELAAQLGLPPSTWSNYEAGVNIPGVVLIKFLALTGVDPAWLLRARAALPQSGPKGEWRAFPVRRNRWQRLELLRQLTAALGPTRNY